MMQSLMKFGAFVATVSTLVAAQTFTSCNPTQNASCPADPALCASFDTDFTQGAMDGWTATAGSVNFVSDGAEFTINKRGDAPTIQTDAYLFFGYVEVTMKAATGTGIVSSIVLQSDDLDEVDWEFLGGDNANVQTNYFGKGNTTTYDRMIQYPVTTPQDTFHTYAVNWTAEAMVFSIDGTAVRTLNYADANGGKNYPQTPVNVRLGIWAGGDPDNNAGTIQWAGGETDYTKTPYTMTVKSIKVVNNNPGKEYQFTDLTGSYESIKTVEGTCSSGSSSSSEGSSSSTPGQFAPGSNSTASEQHNGNSTCTSTVVTVTVTEGESTPTRIPETTIEQTSLITPVPSSIIMDTGSPSLPATSLLPTTALPATNATATTTTPAAFTGAAARHYATDSSRFALTSLVGILMSLLAF